jgi:hypothetical protein
VTPRPEDDAEPETKVPCPVGCESGARVSRTDFGAEVERCAYCEGTGIVSAVRAVAYRYLVSRGRDPLKSPPDSGRGT